MGCSGTLYAFGAYIDTIKDLLELKQSEVEMIGYIGDAGAYITGPLLGLTVDWFGSATMGSVASLLISAGYLFMGMVRAAISCYALASKYHSGMCLAVIAYSLHHALGDFHPGVAE